MLFCYCSFPARSGPSLSTERLVHVYVRPWKPTYLTKALLNFYIMQVGDLNGLSIAAPALDPVVEGYYGELSHA